MASVHTRGDAMVSTVIDVEQVDTMQPWYVERLEALKKQVAPHMPNVRLEDFANMLDEADALPFDLQGNGAAVREQREVPSAPVGRSTAPPGCPEPCSMYPREMTSPIERFEIERIKYLAANGPQGWSLEVDAPDLKVQLTVETEPSGQMVHHAFCDFEADADLELATLLANDPKERASWDDFFGTYMKIIVAEGEEFMFCEFPGFLGMIGRCSYLMWSALELRDKHGNMVDSINEAHTQTMLWRPADVARPGIPTMDASRDDSTMVGLSMERHKDDPFGKTRCVLLIRAVDLLGSPIITKYVVPKLLRIFSVFYCNKLRKEIARRNMLAEKNVTTESSLPADRGGDKPGVAPSLEGKVLTPADKGGDKHGVAPSLGGKVLTHVVYHTFGLEEEGHATSDVKMEEVKGKDIKCADGLIQSSGVENVVTFAAFPVFPDADVVLADFQDFFDDITGGGVDEYSSTDAWVHW